MSRLESGRNSITPLKHIFKTRKYKDKVKEMNFENKRILKRL